MVTKEKFLGSDASDLDSEFNRVITLSNATLTITKGFQVFVGGLIQHTNNITVNHLSSNTTITFLDRLFDDNEIIVNYFTIFFYP